MSRIVLGPRAVLEALRSRHADSVSVVYVSPKERNALREVVAEARKRNVRIEERAPEELDELGAGGRHQGTVAISGEYVYSDVETILAEASQPALLVALDEITDPHNFGAIVRSAVAFGADGVVTMKDRAAPVTPAVVRASSGATEHARIARVTNLARCLRELRDQGLQVVGLAAEGGVSLTEMPPAPAGRVLVVGSEGRGLRRLVREQCDVVARINLVGKIESLNASVAAGVALYEASRRRVAVPARD